MNVRSHQGLQAFERVSMMASQSLAASPITRLSRVAAEAASDKVTLSDTAEALSASDKDQARARSPGQEKFPETLRTNTEADSDKLAYEMAYSRSQISYDISRGDIRLSSTGQIVSEGFNESFEELAFAVDVQKRALYEALEAKGTHPNEIIAKIVDFGNAQSQAYRIGTGVGFDAGLRF